MTGRLLTILPDIETPHLTVRELESRDVHDFASYMLRNEYQTHIALKQKSVDHVRSFVLRTIAQQGREPRRSWYLAGELKSRRVVVADGFLLMPQPGLAEIGWGVHPAYWRQGLGLELARALVAQAFERLGAERVWCKVMGANAASLALARKAGLSPFRSHPEFPIGQGHFAAVEIFALTANDYFDQPY